MASDRGGTDFACPGRPSAIIDVAGDIVYQGRPGYFFESSSRISCLDVEVRALASNQHACAFER